MKLLQLSGILTFESVMNLPPDIHQNILADSL